MENDPVDPEVSALAPRAAEAPVAPASARRWRDWSSVVQVRWVRILVTAVVLLGGTGYIVSAAVSRAPNTPPPATPRATWTEPPAVPTPPPVAGIVAPPPTTCPSSPPLDSITAQPDEFAGPVKLYGQSPVWIPEEFFPQGDVFLNLPGDPPAPYPVVPILWEEGPGHNPGVRAQVTEVTTGAVAWWASRGQTPGQTPTWPVLDFNGDTSGGSGVDGFYAYHSAVILTHAGCYKLDVTWDGGKWHTIFAAGRRTGP